MHAEIQEIPDSIRIKHNLLEKISKKTFILGAGMILIQNVQKAMKFHFNFYSR
jgi:hypothetical protein